MDQCIGGISRMARLAGTASNHGWDFAKHFCMWWWSCHGGMPGRLEAMTFNGLPECAGLLKGRWGWPDSEIGVLFKRKRNKYKGRK